MLEKTGCRLEADIDSWRIITVLALLPLKENYCPFEVHRGGREVLRRKGIMIRLKLHLSYAAFTDNISPQLGVIIVFSFWTMKYTLISY